MTKPRKEERQARFLDDLARTANVRLAAREAGVDHSTAYHWRRKDPAFATAWARAVAQGEAFAGGAGAAAAGGDGTIVWGAGGARPR